MNEIKQALLEKAKELPLSPGVYIMKNRSGDVIYVGKSAKLKNRVSQYFRDGAKNAKTERMVSLVRDFEYILTANEAEALTLENVLIKRYMPRYNILLKDSKAYPYLKVTVNEEYPRVIYTRKREDDGARYFGPYPDQSACRILLDTLYKVVGIPSCKLKFPKDIGKTRPCIYSQIKRCVAPCTGELSAEEYKKTADAALALLSGKTGEVRRILTERMKKASDEERYEAAAAARDGIRALDAIYEKQKVVGAPKESIDALSFAESDLVFVLSLLSIRDGALISKNDFVFEDGRFSDSEDISSLIYSYYSEKSDIPDMILLDGGISEEISFALEDALFELSSKRVSVRVPQRGRLKDIVLLAKKNAEEKVRVSGSKLEEENKTLIRLAELLSLPVVPDRIEAYDISNYGNENIFASMVVTEGGRFKKSDYRSFGIKTDKQDDYYSMYSALSRRFAHIGKEGDKMGIAPDLILVDGGDAHCNVARQAAYDLGVDIPIFGMVKDEHHKTRALTDGESEISIARETAVFRLIYKIQEEAHRFAVSHSGGAKRKSLRRSSLENIEGVGRVRAARLLSYFGTLERVKNASEKELIASGLPKNVAEHIYAFYRKEDQK